MTDGTGVQGRAYATKSSGDDSHATRDEPVAAMAFAFDNREQEAADSSSEPKGRNRSVLFTGVVCFAAGILTSQLVGFWSFVSAVMFNPQDERGILSEPTLVQAEAGKRTDAAPPATPAPQASAASSKPTAPQQGAEARERPAKSESLSELLQCSEARKAPDSAFVQACPPLRQRLPVVTSQDRGSRLLDAREAADRLANGWQTGVSSIETGAISARN